VSDVFMDILSGGGHKPSRAKRVFPTPASPTTSSNRASPDNNHPQAGKLMLTADEIH